MLDLGVGSHCCLPLHLGSPNCAASMMMGTLTNQKCVLKSIHWSQCLQSILAWAEQSIAPFVLLLLIHVFIQHFYSFIQVSLLLISTASSTLHLQAVVAAPPEHTLVKSRDVLILVNLNIWALSLLGIPNQHIWRAIFMQVPKDTFTVRLGTGTHPGRLCSQRHKAIQISAHRLQFWQSLFYSLIAPMLIKQWLIVPKSAHPHL